MLSKARTPLLVVHREFWPEELQLTFRKDTTPAGTNKISCKDCAQVLDWRSHPRTCQCCQATMCVGHSKKAEVRAGRRQLGGGERVTLCTYCADSLKVSKRTMLTESNTHVNSKSSVPTISHPLSAAFCAKPSSSSPSPASPNLIRGVTATASSTISPIGHRKCHETAWRDCSTLLGVARRNPLPPGQPKARPNPRTTTTTTMEASPSQGEGIGVAGNAVDRGGEKEHPQKRVDRGGVEEAERGATPAAVNVQVKWCSHDKRVSFMEEPLVRLFSYSEREKVEGEDRAWVTRESDGAIGGRRKPRTAVASRTKMDRKDEEARAAWSPPPLNPDKAGTEDDDDDDDASSTDSCTSSESTGSDSSGCPLKVDETRNASPTSTSSPSTNPFADSWQPDEPSNKRPTFRRLNPFEQELEGNGNSSSSSTSSSSTSSSSTSSSSTSSSGGGWGTSAPGTPFPASSCNNPFAAPDGGSGSREGGASMQGSSSSSSAAAVSASSAPSPTPEDGGDSSSTSSSTSSTAPVPGAKEGHDTGANESVAAEGAVPMPTGEGEGEGEGDEEPPHTSKPRGFFAFFSTISEAMTTIGVAAAVGVAVLGGRR